MKFAFISEEKVAFSVAALCRLLAVSPNGFYAAQERPRSLHARRDDKLTEQQQRNETVHQIGSTPGSAADDGDKFGHEDRTAVAMASAALFVAVIGAGGRSQGRSGPGTTVAANGPQKGA